MRERILAIGGKLQITGAPRAGVRIEIVLPQVAAG
jgi:signal transduction histidine kinase